MRNIWLAGMTALVLGASGGAARAADATPGPLMRAALASLAAGQGNSPAPRSEESRADWSHVVQLRPGGDIILTVRGARPGTHWLLRADDEGLVVLDTSNPSLPADVRKTLVGTASDRPFTLLAARSGEQQLPRRVRVAPAGVFFEERHVADLADVIRAVPRAQITDVRVRRKHVGSHLRRGVMIGTVIGASLGAVAGASCNSECGVLQISALGALGGAVYGLAIGTFVGAVAPRSPDVIYQVD